MKWSTMTAPILNYAQDCQRRRMRKLIIFGLMAATTLLLLRFGPAVARRLEYQLRQRECLRHTLPAEFVVFDNDPGEAARLRAQDRRYMRIGKDDSNDVLFPAGVHPAGYRCATWEFLAQNSSCVVFLHGRRALGGDTELISIHVSVPSTRVVTLYSQRFMPASSIGNPQRIVHLQNGEAGQFSFDLSLSDRLRLFAGQTHPDDPSRFTIRYELNGVPGTIEGRLGRDGGIELRTASGASWVSTRSPAAK